MLQNARRDKMLQDGRHDPYRSRGKLREPSVCGGCGALYQGGRWLWAKAPPEAREVTCPACQRAADRNPAGRVELAGGFYPAHREEILNLVRNEGEAERHERPLERIMEIAEAAAGAVVTTTGVHLARRIGEALSRSYQGALDLRYGDGETTVRVAWSREAAAPANP